MNQSVHNIIELSEVNNITQLPEEIILKIFQLVNFSDHLNIRLTCSSFNRIMCDQLIWRKYADELCSDPDLLENLRDIHNDDGMICNMITGFNKLGKLIQPDDPSKYLSYKDFLQFNVINLEKVSENLHINRIPQEILYFTALQQLNLPNHSIKTIPCELSRLTNLEFLGLQSNQISSIPFSCLTQLETLDLKGNLIDTISKNNAYNLDNADNIDVMTRLQTLVLGGNKLTTIPFSIKKLTNLCELDLGYNNLTNVDAVLDMSIPVLSLAGNNITQTNKKISSNLPLTYLDLSSNNLDLFIDPTYTTSLIGLETLLISKCHQTISSDWLIGLTNITLLDLSYSKNININQINNMTKLVNLNLADINILELPRVVSISPITSLKINNNKLTSLSHHHINLSIEQLYANNNLIKHAHLNDFAYLEILDLSNNRLQDIQLRGMTNLKNLNLSNNLLLFIPKITSRQIQHVDISNNLLTCLPKINSNNLITLRANNNKITHFDHPNYPKLQILDLSHNRITRPKTAPNTPFQLSGLTDLQTIDLSNNFIDKFPDICHLTNLKTINLSHNKLHYLSHDLSRYNFEGLNNLETLDISFNCLSELPQEICNLTRLVVLNCSNNKLHSLPCNTNQLIGLKKLYIDNNLIKTLPNNFTRLVDLTLLRAHDNQLTDLDIPPNINYLTIHSNNFKTICTDTFTRLQHLELNRIIATKYNFSISLKILGINECSLTSIPTSIFQCFELKDLYIGGNQISTIDCAITRLSKLTILCINDNPIQYIDNISMMTSIKKLGMRRITSKLLFRDSVVFPPKLKMLSLSDNNLDTLPSSVNNLELNELYIWGNPIQGIGLQNSLEHFLNLKTLDLYQTNLTTLPRIIRKLTCLEILDISRNNISFNKLFVQTIAPLIKLKKLYFRYNNLTQISPNISKLTSLEMLSLSNNQLSSLPDSLIKCVGLKKLYLHDNLFEIFPDVLNPRSKKTPPFIKKLHIDMLNNPVSHMLDEDYVRPLPKEVNITGYPHGV